jgi:hypothetical protein
MYPNPRTCTIIPWYTCTRVRVHVYVLEYMCTCIISTMVHAYVHTWYTTNGRCAPEQACVHVHTCTCIRARAYVTYTLVASPCVRVVVHHYAWRDGNNRTWVRSHVLQDVGRAFAFNRSFPRLDPPSAIPPPASPRTSRQPTIQFVLLYYFAVTCVEVCCAVVTAPVRCGDCGVTGALPCCSGCWKRSERRRTLS